MMTTLSSMISARARGVTIVAVLIAVLVSALGCNDADPGGGQYRISSSEIDAVTIAAARGDAKAAFRLYEHYEFYVKEHEPAIRWLRVSAKAGDLEAAWALGRLLADYEAPAEGLYWLESAASRGDERAKADLRDIERERNKVNRAPK